MLLNHKIRLLNRQSMLFTERAKERQESYRYR